MQINIDILNEFKQITSKDIQAFFTNALNFFSTDYNTLLNYYSGNISSIESGPFSRLEELERERDVMFSAFQDHARQLNNLKWWLVIEQLENVDSRINTVRNINKWARSSISKVAYDPSISVSYTLKQNQTLERVSQDILKNTNPNDDWADIALSNALTEEQYTTQGGADIQLQFSQINRGLQIDSVVDVMMGKSIYGKDFDKSLQFDSTTEDLKVLDYDNTVLQAVQILALLKKNSNPDYPNDGLQPTIAVGTNRAMLNFPIIIRQVSEAFATDDSLKEFTVLNITLDQDNLVMEYSVKTRLNETQDGQVVI